MVIEPKRTTVAYRCPACGQSVMSAVDIFSLNAAMVKLKCECGGSELTAVDADDGRVRLSVPCLACPKPHVFTVNRSVFFGKDIFLLPCPYTNLDVGFLGSPEAVGGELERVRLELVELLGEGALEGLTEQAQSHEDNDGQDADPCVADIVRYVVRELLEDGHVFCNCPEHVCNDCETELTDDGIRVSCRDCGASALVKTDSLIRAYDFLNADSLTLT